MAVLVCSFPIYINQASDAGSWEPLAFLSSISTHIVVFQIKICNHTTAIFTHFIFYLQLNTEWTQIEVIDLINDGTGLGFGIIGGRSTGVVVKTILPGGVADIVSTCSNYATGWWFSPGPPVSSTNKTDHLDITEILWKVMLNTKEPNLNQPNSKTS